MVVLSHIPCFFSWSLRLLNQTSTYTRSSCCKVWRNALSCSICFEVTTIDDDGGLFFETVPKIAVILELNSVSSNSPSARAVEIIWYKSSSSSGGQYFDFGVVSESDVVDCILCLPSI